MVKMYMDKGEGTTVKVNPHLGDVTIDEARKELEVETGYQGEAAYRTLSEEDFSILYDRNDKVLCRLWIGESPEFPQQADTQ